MNISSVLIHARPEHSERIQKSLAALPGVEVHAVADDGKIIVTVEDLPPSLAADTITDLHNLDGVLNASMVYNFCDDELNH